MRGPGLLFLTFVVAMPAGRATLQEYLALATARFAAQSPLSEILAAMATIALLLLFLVMRQGKPRLPVYLISRETRGSIRITTIRAASHSER